MSRPAEIKAPSAVLALLVFSAVVAGACTPSADNNTYRTCSAVATNLGSTVYVGHNGTNNVLEINLRANVADGGACIGHAAPADKNTALVLGAGSTWESHDTLCVGKNGSDNRLIVVVGARVFSESGCIGENPGGNRNSARVAGPGSEWVVDCGLVVGSKGSSSRLTVEDGGVVTAGSVVVGAWGQSQGNMVEVGRGSLLTVEEGCGTPVCEIRRGTLQMSGGTVRAANLSVWTTGTLTGDGTIEAPAGCAGAYLPGSPLGSLVHHGDLALAGSCRAEFEIGGYGAGVGFDIAQVDGVCALGGTLRVILRDGFEPQSGDRFQIITAGEVLGDFSNVEVVNGPADLEAHVIVSPTSVVVEFGARDGDADGLPDPWEEKYFGAPCEGDPDADDDHDGRSNYDEYVADTDPRDARSQFRIELEPLEKETAVEFMSSTDRVYTLEYTSDITDPAGITWTKVCKDVKGWGGLMQLIHENPAQRGFYRVRVGFPKAQ